MGSLWNPYWGLYRVPLLGSLWVSPLGPTGVLIGVSIGSPYWGPSGVLIGVPIRGPYWCPLWGPYWGPYGCPYWGPYQGSLWGPYWGLYTVPLLALLLGSLWGPYWGPYGCPYWGPYQGSLLGSLQAAPTGSPWAPLTFGPLDELHLHHLLSAGFAPHDVEPHHGAGLLQRLHGRAVRHLPHVGLVHKQDAVVHPVGGVGGRWGELEGPRGGLGVLGGS